MAITTPRLFCCLYLIQSDMLFYTQNQKSPPNAQAVIFDFCIVRIFSVVKLNYNYSYSKTCCQHMLRISFEHIYFQLKKGQKLNSI